MAAVASGGFTPDEIDIRFSTLDQTRQVVAQGLRVLRTGPYCDASVLIVREGAGRPDRSMHLIRPDIAACQRGRAHLSLHALDVAFLQQKATLSRGVRNGFGGVIEGRQRRQGAPPDA